MSGDTDKAKISDNQDEDKKSNAGDGQTTEDDSSQDSKGESVAPVEPAGNTDVDQQDAPKTDEETKPPEGDVKEATANGKDDEAPEDPKDGEPKSEAKVDAKKEENGENHDEEEKDEDVKENSKPAKKPAPKKKAKKEDTEEEDEEEEEEEEEEEGDEGDEGEEGEDGEKKPAADKKPVKKPKAKKSEEDGDEEEEEGDEEGEEEEEEEEEEEAPKPKPPKKEPTEPPVPVPAGKGIPLGHIGNVEISLSRFKTNDQKILHQYLYGQLCLDRNVKRNIKKFKGYPWAIGSADYKAKLEETTKLEPKQLRSIAEMLDLDKKGSPSELAARVVGFLQQPGPNSPHARGSARPPPPPAATTPGGRPRRSAAVKVHNRGYSDEEYESDPGSKVKAARPPRDESESDGSFNPSGSEEVDSDFDPEGGESASGGSRKRKPAASRRSSAKPGKRGRKPKGGKGKGAKKGPRGRGKARSDSGEESDDSESGSEDASGSDADDSDEPKSKRGRAPAVAKGRKGPVAKNAKATPVKRKAPTPPAKKKAAGKPVGRPAKKAKKGSDEESGEGSEEGSDEEEEGSEEEEEGSEEESDGPADKKKKRPPTDDEIKKYVKQILEGANLEEITMKTVCKQVYSHYPDFDLAHKKDFIKATVKSLISS